MTTANCNLHQPRTAHAAQLKATPSCRWQLAVLCAALLCPFTALAASGQGGHSNAVFVAQVIALLLVGRLLGEFMLRIGQPAIMGQLLAGVLLGPSLLGVWYPLGQHALFPVSAEQRVMIDGVAQLGILMLLLLTGMETDLSVVGKVRRPAIAVSLLGILVPFAAGFALGELLPEAMLPNPQSRLITALFCGTALSISSIKIVAVIVRGMNFEHRRVGQVLLAAAILDDTVGWILLAAILGLAERGHVDAHAILQTLAGTLIFLALSFTLGWRLVSWLIRIANDYLHSELAVVTVILIVMGLFALLTNALGVHTVLGAFVAGMLIGRSPILTRHIREQLRGLIVALFMPVFFGLAGLTADLSMLRNPVLLGWLGVFIVVASIGKFAGSYLGGRLGALSGRESLALGCGMNARGSTEVILATLGLAAGALNTTLFTLIVTMALATTLVMPPMLRWALARVPISAQESGQLERMAFEARGYVPNLERLLVAIDQSPSGKLAARCVGLLAGAWGMPTTVMALRAEGAPVAVRGNPEASAVRAAMAAAVMPHAEDERTSSSIQIAAVARPGDGETAISEVSRQGFDLLWVGTEPGADHTGVIHDNVAVLASGFGGHVSLVFARGQLAANQLSRQPRILVAVTGTAHSRRAVEVALALAQASNGTVTALHVAGTVTRQMWRRNLQLARALQGGDEAILREIAELAQQYGATLTALLRSAAEPAAGILQELRRIPYSMVVLGVTRRPGDTLALGATARAVLADSPQSVLLHAS
jgi:Kef-type K+ transport system membrane component KefB/nucleotide-binding universal stress UspA family protein